MKLDTAFLKSKVAQRIFTLFLICALVPITVLAVLSLRQVTQQLDEQSRQRLHQTSKAVGMAIYERLLFLESEMRMIISNLDTGHRTALKAPDRESGEDFSRKFESLALVTDGGVFPLLNRIRELPASAAAEQQHLRSGMTLVQVDHASPGRILMSRAVDIERHEKGILVGEVNSLYLWGTGYEHTLPATTEMCVLDHAYRVLFCSEKKRAPTLKQFAAEMDRAASGQLEWQDGDTDYLARYWSIPLKFGFFTPKWTVVLTESKGKILAPVATFRKNFLLVVFISLGVVLLLVVSQIRKILVPLEKLQEGTRRIAAREFQSRVSVASGDEFEELAISFNTMADRLGRQFNALATMAEIDRAILSVLDTEKIVDAVLARMRDILSCDGVSVALLDSLKKSTGRIYFRGEGVHEKQVEIIDLGPEEMQRLRQDPDTALLATEELPQALGPLAKLGCRSSVVLPIFVKGALHGFIALGYASPPSLEQEDLLQARQLADLVAVSFHNSQLYQELKQQAMELEHSNRVKSEFLSVMSHELRTPLTAIMGYTEMVKVRLLGEINSPQEDALEKAARQSQRLLDLINSIMDATKIEAKVLEIESRETSLNALLDEIRLVNSAPLSKGLTLHWDYPPGLPTIRTDREKLRHILQHLINNAIKFTENGRIAVTARHQTESRTLEFTVADTGIGIPQEQIPSIFDIFYQGDSSETRSYGGLGLGLYIVRTFAELLGGKVKVESEIGNGSTFIVALPCELSSRQE